jgi:NAD(P)-dependent dehydrogenase (short-subunit alcohol dehydrogenase family)
MARRVVLTGAASGIGLVMAKRFSELGDRVALCDSSHAHLAAAQAALPNAITALADVTDEGQMQQFFAQVSAGFAGVDIFISNSGTGGPAGPLDALQYDAWQACLSVNLNGAFLGARWASEMMRAQGAGVILFMSSSSGLHGVPMRSPYVAAKWGLIGLTKTLAMELGPSGVRVNAICPGAVEGDRMQHVLEIEANATGRCLEEMRQQYSQGVSLRRFVSPEDIADMAVFLSSEAARQVTGQALAVDGHTERMV